jgi:hypothetical protein
MGAPGTLPLGTHASTVYKSVVSNVSPLATQLNIWIIGVTVNTHHVVQPPEAAMASSNDDLLSICKRGRDNEFLTDEPSNSQGSSVSVCAFLPDPFSPARKGSAPIRSSGKRARKKEKKKKNSP